MIYLNLDKLEWGRGERNQDKSKNKAERMEEAYAELPLTSGFQLQE